MSDRFAQSLERSLNGEELNLDPEAALVFASLESLHFSLEWDATDRR
jgi:hypothetical protein